MDILKAFRVVLWIFIATALAETTFNSTAAESVPLRLAIGPFFAPPGNATLQSIANIFPDLLNVKLSQGNDFQLVERARISTLWNELQLTANGLTSREAMLKLGNVLACDRFVSGSLFVTTSNIQVWLTVVDTHKGIVTDFTVLPVNPSDVQPAIDGVAAFLAQSHTRREPQKFIALGRFVDLSISSSHEDWSARLRAMIEKHFHENGYGVVEHEAVTPVFEEFQLEQAGFSESKTNRVKFQPSFWIIDGGCKWVRDTEDKLSVAIRIRKVGEGEQTLNFRAWPDAQMEANIIETIRIAMGDTNRMPDAQLIQSQLAAHLAELERFLMKSAPLTADRYSSDPNAALNAYRKDQENKAAAINEAQSVLLLDPGNLRAKWVLGQLYFLKVEEPDLRERGIQILEELSAGPNPGYAALAESELTDTDTTIRGPDGKDIKVPPARPKKDPDFESRFHPRIISIQDNTNVDAVDLPLPELPSFSPVASFPVDGNINGGQMLALGGGLHIRWDDGLLVALGTNLFLFDYQNHLQKTVCLPISVQTPISALAVDKECWWVGTTGAGVLRVDKTGEPSRNYGETNGLLMPTITALCRIGDRLWIGFGFQQSGGLGYLDLKTDKFIGLAPDANVGTPTKEVLNAPLASPVLSIEAGDGKTIWVTTRMSVRQYDSATAQLLKAFEGITMFSAAGSNFVAVSAISGAMPGLGALRIFNTISNHWTNIAFSQNRDQNNVWSLYADGAFLWAGGKDMIKLINPATSQVLAAYKCTGVGYINRILTTGNDVWFAASDFRTIKLYHFAKPSPPAKATSETETDFKELQRLQTGSVPLTAQKYSTNNDSMAAHDAWLEAQRNAEIKEAQKVLLLDPGNILAKWSLAKLYFYKFDEPALREEGMQMLQELTTCTNAAIARLAYRKLTDADSHMVFMNGRWNEIAGPGPANNVLPQTNQIPNKQLATSEAQAHIAELKRFEMKTAPVTPDRYTTNDNEYSSLYRKDQENKEAAIKEAQKVLLLDPGNLHAKLTLGELYYLKLDEPEVRERGIQMLEDLTTCTNAQIAALAERELTEESGFIFSKDGKQVKIPSARASNPPRLKSLTDHQLFPALGTNQYHLDLPAPEFPAFSLIGSFFMGQEFGKPATASFLSWDGGLILIQGTNLSIVDEQNRQNTTVALPLPAYSPITAMAVDKDCWWFGTRGGGLFRIDKSGKFIRAYTEADGLLMPSITALCRNDDKLWVGFGFQQSGGLGYLNLKTDKFIGISADVNIGESFREDLKGPPNTPVISINAGGEKDVWVATDRTIRRYDSVSGKMLSAFPKSIVISAASTNFVAVSAMWGAAIEPGSLQGMHIYNASSNHWSQLEFSQNSDQGVLNYNENIVWSICPDGNLFWAGGNGVIKLIDPMSSNILKAYKFMGIDSINFIHVQGNEIWFGCDNHFHFDLYHFTRPIPTVQLLNAAVRGAARTNSSGPVISYSGLSDYYYNLAMVNVPRRDMEQARVSADSFRQSLLLNPNNLKAKLMYANFRIQTGYDQYRVPEVLQEIIDAGDPAFTESAKWLLVSFTNNYVAGEHNPVPLPAQRGIYPLEEPDIIFNSYHGVTAVTVGRFGALFAQKKSLMLIGDMGQNILKPSVKHTITALAGDNASFWLGTQGEGLVQVSPSGETLRTYDTKDGLNMACISALSLFQGRVWIGFGSYLGNGYGGVGYLDIASGKFTAITGPPHLKTSDHHPGSEPDSTVTIIKTPDEKSLWVASDNALHRYDIHSQTWTLELPFGPLSLATSSNYIAAADPAGGIMICDVATHQWRKINPSTDFLDNLFTAVRFDTFRPGLLWVGGEKAISLVDVSTSEFIADYQLDNRFNQTVRWINPGQKKVWYTVDAGLDSPGFYADGNDPPRTSTSFYRLDKPEALTEKNPSN